MGYEWEREVAVEAVCEAAKLCVDVQASLVTSLEKDDRSPVTVADFGSQALVCRRLQSTFANDSIVGEEDASVLREAKQAGMRETVTRFVRAYTDADEEAVCSWIDAGNGSVAERFWTLDPIDGTKGFLRNDQYAVALALIDDGEVKVATLACPALPVNLDEPDGERGMLFVAVRGEGTFCRPLSGGDMIRGQVAGPENAKAWRFVESVEASHGDHDAQKAVARAVGIQTPSLRMDSQAKYGAVARGDAALYVRLPSPKYSDYREKIWDHAAGSLVVEEAGGKVSDMFGHALDFATDALMENNRGVIVSSSEIHKQVIEALNGV